jgi:hypothetical protein
MHEQAILKKGIIPIQPAESPDAFCYSSISGVP